MKVAALTLNRSRVQVGEVGKFQLDASLNFKRSDDLHGYAKDRDGRNITVTFGLELTKAVLEVGILLDNGDRVPGAKVSRVPFVQGLTRERQVEIKEERAASYQISGKASVDLKLVDPLRSDVGLSGGAQAERGRSRKAASTAAFRSLSINATHTNDAIHWEITPAVDENGVDGAYLVGEVFLSAARNKKIPAAAISWNRGKSKESVEVVGSVVVDIGSMKVSTVKFTDEDGVEISWRAVDSEVGGKSSVTDAILNVDKLKERLVRQIIRKHLVEQGMGNEGSQLEICSARG